jgi:molecular chaperone GrpE
LESLGKEVPGPGFQTIKEILMSKRNPYVSTGGRFQPPSGSGPEDRERTDCPLPEEDARLEGSPASAGRQAEISPEGELAGRSKATGEEEIPPCPRCLAAEEAAARALAEAGDTRLRALAEADNLRKRLSREKEEAMRYIASAVLSDILPGLDNLDLALEHAKNSEACKDLLLGVEMTRKLMLESLKKHGLEPVGAPGEVFDPAIHEAVSLVNDPDTPDGAVCALLSKGYMLRDRLLRPAKVVVCKK